MSKQNEVNRLSSFREQGLDSTPNEQVLMERLDGYGSPNIVCSECGDTKVRDILLRSDRIVAKLEYAYCPHCVDECGCFTREKIQWSR